MVVGDGAFRERSNLCKPLGSCVGWLIQILTSDLAGEGLSWFPVKRTSNIAQAPSPALGVELAR
eukprot:1017963-Pleurochrysis_carterae.AAC.4